MPRPEKYPDELRERAVRLVFDSQHPIVQVARIVAMPWLEFDTREVNDAVARAARLLKRTR